MDKNKKLTIITIVLVSLLFVQSFVIADGGSRSTRSFSVTYEGQPIKDNEFYAAYFRCVKDVPSYEDLNSRNSKPFQKLGPLRFVNGGYDADRNCYWVVSGIIGDQGTCKDSKCDFGVYGSPEFKFGVYLPDENRVFLSNEVIHKRAYYNTYKVNLQENGDIIVKDTTAFYKKIHKWLFYR